MHDLYYNTYSKFICAGVLNDFYVDNNTYRDHMKIFIYLFFYALKGNFAQQKFFE